MSAPGQDVQAAYAQYQAAVRQLQLYEQQEAMLANQLDQYRSNLETLKGLQDHDGSEDFIFPLSDILLVKGQFTEVKEVLVDIGTEYYLPTNFAKAEEVIKEKVDQLQDLLDRITKDKNQIQAITSQLQSQISRMSQM